MRSGQDANIKITYRQLSDALRSLGFQRGETEEFIAFREIQHDALIVLPPKKANTIVDAPHMIVVRNTVVGRGVATEQQLRAALLRARTSQPAHPAQHSPQTPSKYVLRRPRTAHSVFPNPAASNVKAKIKKRLLATN